jgi:catechol 2,3-dioxygenase-like lactoylglutathione lyase family enzyme
VALNHVALTVGDREASAAFYGEHFGMTERVHDDEHLLILGSPDGALLALTEGVVPDDLPPTNHFGFRVASADEVRSARERMLAGAVIAVQIAATAIGLGDDNPWALAAGLMTFAAAAAVQLVRFRRLNGVWLGGFASRVVLGTGTATSTSYAVALGMAIWAAFESQWWLMTLCSLAGGAAYALSGRRWLGAYRARPAAHGRGESAAWLALVTVAAIAGLVLLVLNR